MTDKPTAYGVAMTDDNAGPDTQPSENQVLMAMTALGRVERREGVTLGPLMHRPLEPGEDPDGRKGWFFEASVIT